MFGLGPSELVIVGVIAVLLFGKNLPQVAQKVGRHYRDLRRTLSDMQSQVNFNEAFEAAPVKAKPRKTYEPDDYEEVSAPKFIPPSAPSSSNQEVA